MKNIFNFYYYGIKAQVNSNNNLFIKLISSKFNGFIKSSNTEKLLKINAKILFKQVHSFSHSKLETIISNNISISNGLKEILSKSYYLDARINTHIILDDNLTITIEYKPSIKFMILNLVSKNVLQRQLFQNIIKTEIEQVLLNLLTNKKNLICLHAAAVEKNGKSLIFSGLNGVGKSTLAQYLTKNKGYKYFGDNYILVGSKNVYKSPDLIRLSDKSIKYLNVNSIQGFGFGKNIIKSNNVSNQTKATLSEIYLVNRGKKYSNKKENSTLLDTILKYQYLENEDVTNSKLSYILNKKANIKLDRIIFTKLILHSFNDLENFSNEL